jgi:hypothetical protein
MKITDLVGVVSQERKLKTISKASSKEERRNMEEQLLKPAELPSYTKDEPTVKDEIESKTVMFVFSSMEEVQLLKKHFKISDYKSQNVRASNMNLFVDFLKALESGELEYDKEGRKFSLKTLKRVKRIK